MTDEVEVINDESQPIEGEVIEKTKPEQSEEVTEELTAEQIDAKEAEIAKQKEETRSKRKERNNRRATAHIQKLEKELQTMREEMAYLRGRQEAKTDNQEPDPDDYETPREYREALQRWADEQEPETETHSDQEITSVPVGPQIEPEVIEAYQSAGEERFGDEFNDMMEAAANNEFDCSPFMADAIFRSEVGPEVAMHLYDHPREATKIAKMSPAAQIREIIKLEAKVKPEPVRNVSRAPKPVNPEKGGNPTTVDLSKPMDAAEYRKIRMQQLYGK